MTVNTGGKVRGMIGRWLMRLEAAGKILRMSFLGVTAASTLTSALALIGMQRLAPYVLGAGILATFVFAYLYVEVGVFNRKNRERAERGMNFSRPDMYIDDSMIGAAIFAAIHGRPPEEDELEAIEQAVEQPYKKHQNGVDIE